MITHDKGHGIQILSFMTDSAHSEAFNTACKNEGRGLLEQRVPPTD